MGLQNWQDGEIETEENRVKKVVFVLMLMAALLGSGCAGKDEPVPQQPAAESGAVEPGGGSAAAQESSAPQETAPQYDISGVDDYLAAVEEQAGSIQHFLEHEAMTQDDMNVKSQELYQLWDGALNHLWGELKTALTEERFAALLEEQLVWIADKEAAVEAAGKEFEGGSIYPLIVNSEAAAITEVRVYEFYALLKEAAMP